MRPDERKPVAEADPLVGWLRAQERQDRGEPAPPPGPGPYGPMAGEADAPDGDPDREPTDAELLAIANEVLAGREAEAA